MMKIDKYLYKAFKNIIQLYYLACYIKHFNNNYNYINQPVASRMI